VGPQHVADEVSLFVFVYTYVMIVAERRERCAKRSSVDTGMTMLQLHCVRIGQTHLHR